MATFDLTVREEAGLRYLEGPHGEPLMRDAYAAGLIVEACINARVFSVLLHASNLTPKFFDLSSGEAAEVLQKLRQYRVRLAAVCLPGAVKFSSRFPELLLEEKRGKHFGVFDSIDAAKEWLRK